MPIIAFSAADVALSAHVFTAFDVTVESHERRCITYLLIQSDAKLSALLTTAKKRHSVKPWYFSSFPPTFRKRKDNRVDNACKSGCVLFLDFKVFMTRVKYAHWHSNAVMDQLEGRITWFDKAKMDMRESILNRSLCLVSEDTWIYTELKTPQT